MTVTGGTFINFNPATDVIVDYSTSAGFTFGSVVKEGFMVENLGDGTYGVVEDPAYGKVAKIDDTYYATLAEALAAADEGETIVIIDDVILTETLVNDKTVILDLNGKTISMNDASGATAALIKNNGTLTITDNSAEKNGKITFNTTTPSAANSYASNTISNYGTITIEAGTIENTSLGSACYALDNYAGSTATINGGKFVAEKTTVRIFNWTNGDAAKATLNINGGEILSKDGYGVNVNAGNAPAIELNITGGTITTEDTDYALAVYIVNKGSAENLKLSVSGGTFNGNFALNGVTSTTMAEDAISITGGSFEGIICYDTPAYGFVSGGSFNTPVEYDYCASGFIPKDNGDGTYGVKEGQYVAEVNGTKYESLADAIAAADEGDTIVIIDDVTLTETLTIAAGKTVTLDLAGYTIVYNSTTQGEAMITNRGTLTINDSVGTGVINYNYTGAADSSYSKGNYTISNGGTLTVNGGKITIANLSAHAKYPIDNNSTSGDAILVINGGHLYNYNTAAIRQFCNSTTNKNSVTINGGVVEGYSAIWVQNPGSKTVNGSLTITGGEIKSTAKAYVNGTAALKDVASKIYFTIDGNGGAWSTDSFLTITGGIFNENVNLSTEAPATLNVTETSATFNGYLELPAVYVAQIGEQKYQSLAEAFAAAKDGDTIELLCDITYSEDNGVVNGEYVDGLVYTGDKSFTVDFGGFTITDNGEINDYLVYLKNTGSKDNEITFKNGKIIVNSENTVTTWAAITVGANSATHKTTLNLEGMEIVNGNPNDASNQVIRVRKGSVVNLNNGTVVTSDGTSYGVVAETGSIVNVNDGAKVVHTNSKTTTGNQVYTALSGNGTINVYDGAVIESDNYAIHNMTTGNAVINIYGGTITAPVAVRASTNGGTGESATVTISGGTINGELQTYSDAASIEVSGGSFSEDPEEFCVPGYHAPVTDGRYVVEKNEAVVAIDGNGVEYDDLETALKALGKQQGGGTIVLMKDVLISEYDLFDISVYEGVTLDLNGYVLETTYITVFNGGYIVDNSSDNSGLLKCAKGNAIIRTSVVADDGVISDGSNIPVWDEAQGGYIFVNYVFNATGLTLEDGKLKYTFAFFTESIGSSIIANSAVDAYLTIEVRASWTKGGTTYYEDIQFSDDQISEIVGGSGKSFYLTVSNYANFENLTFQAVVLSGTDMIATTAPIAASTVLGSN